MPAGRWVDKYTYKSGFAMFDGWRKRDKPCPGQSVPELPIAPMYPTGTKVARTLQIRVIVKSGKDCPCGTDKEKRLDMTQVLLWGSKEDFSPKAGAVSK